MTPSEVTLIENAIHNPLEPRHFMTFDTAELAIVLDGIELALTQDGVKVKEVSRTIHDPVYYLPQKDIQMDLLTPSEKTTQCPLKGQTRYFDIEINGKHYKDIAWCYVEVLDFDSRLARLKNRVAFDTSVVTLITP